MSYVTEHFTDILSQAKNNGVPVVGKEKGVLREYLQAKLLSQLYTNQLTKKLSFIGGTSLRLLHGIDRFSEDLDFDNLGLSDDEVETLVREVTRQFENEGYQIELKVTVREYKKYFELKFLNTLFPLGMADTDAEKLFIKFDYSSNWKYQVTQSMLMKSFGFSRYIVTNTLDQKLVQKLTAYVQRKETQARDIYDVVWLFAQGAKLDREFMQVNKLDDILERAKEKFATENIKRGWEDKLRPFLFNDVDTQKLTMFGEVLDRLS